MRNMSTGVGTRIRAAAVGLALGWMWIAAMPAMAQTTGFNHTDAGPYDYNTTGNWVDGVINGIWDSSLTLAFSQTATFGSNTTLTTGLYFGYAGSKNLILRADGTGPYTLTLGGDITDLRATTGYSVTFSSATANEVLNVDLGGANRTFDIASGRTLTFMSGISGSGVGITKTGLGTLNLNGVNTYSGATAIDAGVLAMAGAASVANSDVTANGGTFQFLNGVVGPTTRAASVSLKVAGSILAKSTSNTKASDAITGALTIDVGESTVTLNPQGASGYNALTAASLARANLGTALFRGNNLGVNTIASQTGGSANLIFTAAPTAFLVGGGGAAGTTTISIIPWAMGDTTSAGVGTSFVTYDADNGIRTLNPVTEYDTTIVSSVVSTNNVRLNGTGVLTLTGNATINALLLNNTNGIDGGQTLTISSGAIMNMTNVGITNNIAFGAAEGVLHNVADILTINGGVSGSGGLTKTGGGSTYIYGVVATTGGGGVTINSGNLTFTGAGNNTFTGTTTLNAGKLILGKAANVISITGDLVINGGVVHYSNGFTQQGGNDQIADTATLTLNGGTFDTASGISVVNETIANLVVTGGSISMSASIVSPVLTVLGNTTLSGGTISIGNRGRLKTTDLAISGSGLLNCVAGNSSSDGYVQANGLLTITQPASGAFTPIALSNTWVPRTATLYLNSASGLTFVGDGGNTNSTTIAASFSGSGSAPLNQIVITNTTTSFTVGDGAAAVDLIVQPNVVGAGGLTKSGAGVLELDGVNTYSGTTTVDAGALLIGGIHSSLGNVIVNAGGTLGGRGTNALAVGKSVSLAGVAGTDAALAPGAGGIGTLSVSGGNVVAGDHSRLSVELDSTKVGGTDGSSDLLAITGGHLDLTSGQNTLNVSVLGAGTLKGPYTIATFDSTAPAAYGTFETVTGLPLGTKIRYSDTNIVVSPGQGTVVTIQ